LRRFPAAGRKHFVAGEGAARPKKSTSANSFAGRQLRAAERNCRKNVEKIFSVMGTFVRSCASYRMRAGDAAGACFGACPVPGS